MRTLSLSITAILIMTSCVRGGLTVAVPATHSIYFAGKTSPVAPAPGRQSTDYFGDLADENAIPDFVDVMGMGDRLSLQAAGMWGHAPGPDYLSGPDGRGVRTGVIGSYVDYGVSNIFVEYNTLIGVFTTNEGPTIGRSPTGLAFGDDMSHPLLNQAFAIGSMLEVTVPTGASVVSHY